MLRVLQDLSLFVAYISVDGEDLHMTVSTVWTHNSVGLQRIHMPSKSCIYPQSRSTVLLGVMKKTMPDAINYSSELEGMETLLACEFDALVMRLYRGLMQF